MMGVRIGRNCIGMVVDNTGIYICCTRVWVPKAFINHRFLPRGLYVSLKLWGGHGYVGSRKSIFKFRPLVSDDPNDITPNTGLKNVVGQRDGD